MLDKLPYDLSTGVTATREGLDVHMDMCTQIIHGIGFESVIQFPVSPLGRLIPWPDAAERLRYREGEPWCCPCFDEPDDIQCVAGAVSSSESASMKMLHRLAAILCDDAEAFRVLHWCVTNLGGES